MSTVPLESQEKQRAITRWAILPIALALLAAAPTIRGGFLSGDDVQLIRDHVLVNRPSLPHLAKLFAVPHRDLYQPVPLATFSFECWIMRRLGLTPTADGPNPGAWICHLGNILIHATGAGLVFMLARRLCGRTLPAVIVASLFAIHPLNAECFAWLSGRIMMLSTLFTLATLIAADSLLERGGGWRIGLVILMAVLAMMSKISIALPALLLLLPWIRRRRPSVQWWMAFAGTVVVTAVFVAINVYLSRRQLATAEEALQGSRWARAIIALGWYLRHYLVPTGLSAGHPAGLVVTMADPRVLPSALMLAGWVALCGIAARRTRYGSAALVWFFAAITPTLPLVPTRSVLVAERYMYLPGIAIHAMVAVVVCRWLARVAASRRAGMVQAAGVGLAILVAIPLIGATWHSASFYGNNISRTRRIADFYPEHGGVWTRHAWALYDVDRFEEAIRAADVELETDPDPSRSDAYQVQGMSLLRLGRPDEALAKLQAAVAADPNDEMAYLRLATAQSETGRLEEAAANFHHSVERVPNYNLAIVGWGQTLRKLGRLDEASGAFRRVLENNAYDPVATVALAEIELGRGEIEAAARRLEGLLAWMPENSVARANLGVCYLRLGNRSGALREFRRAIQLDPAAVEPRLSLAQALADAGQPQEAMREFDQLIQKLGHANPAALIAYSDFLVGQQDLRAAAALWSWAIRRAPENPEFAAWHAWICAQAEDWPTAEQWLSSIPTEKLGSFPAALADVVLQIHANEPAPAVATVEGWVQSPTPESRDARARLRTALRDYGLRHPENPWPYYLMVQLLAADGDLEAARMGLQAFEQLCTDEAWRARARALLPDGAGSPPAD